jgi:hypothetical protein
MVLSAELQQDAILDAAEEVVNGDAVGEDGTADASAVVENGLEPSGTTTEVDASGTTTLTAMPDSLSADPLSLPTDPTNATDLPAAGPSTAKKTWQAHNLDIDLISLKLSKHKYLTPSDFLADISKIEENAEKLCDPDRITKIGEMGAHARMHVLNFDPAWEPRFEAYAERVRGRKLRRQKEREEKKKAEEGVVEVNGVTEGEGEVEGSLKRPRDDLEDITESERGEKRQKEDIVMEEPTDDSTITPILPQPTEITTLPPPRPTYPPFILPSQSLSNLSSTLTHATTSFNIEQLEQLRAACFDTIWKYRADWDRTVCFREVGKVVDGLVQEVEEMREEMGDYGA